MAISSMESTATYSFIKFRTEDWRQEELIGRDGKRYRVEGYVDGKCPVDKCGGLCCEKVPLLGQMDQGPCEFWNEGTKLCHLHERGGIGVKPLSCVSWPRSQLDIDTVNERYAVGEKKCYLKVVEI